MTTYRIVRIGEDSNTRARVRGLVAFDPECGFAQAVTLAMASESKKESAERRAASKLRQRLLKDAESAGAWDTVIDVRAVKPSELAGILECSGRLQYSCPVTGTWGIVPADESYDESDAGEQVASAESAREYARALAYSMSASIESARERYALPAGQ